MSGYSPKQWAAWALVGDPCGRVPGPLRDMETRIVRAIKYYEAQDTVPVVDLLGSGGTVRIPRPYVDNTGDDGGY